MAHDLLVCRSCGNLRDVCSDPTIDWHPHQSVCWPTATTQWAQRQLRERYGPDTFKAGEIHPLEGVALFVAQSAPAPEDDPLA